MKNIVAINPDGELIITNVFTGEYVTIKGVYAFANKIYFSCYIPKSKHQ